MLERRKEESESVGRYQGMVVSLVIGAIIVWAAPWTMVFIFDLDDEADLFTPPTSSSNSTKGLPKIISDKVEDVYNLGIWLVRIILLLGVLISVTMLRLLPGGAAAPPAAPAGRTPPRRTRAA